MSFDDLRPARADEQFARSPARSRLDLASTCIAKQMRTTMRAFAACLLMTTATLGATLKIDYRSIFK
jgi:hypothetical protein